MGKRLFGWELAGFLWTGLAGTVLHFFYDWTGRAAWAMAFSAVNESVWEHMKLLYVPVFVFTLVQAGFLGRQYPDLFDVRGRWGRRPFPWRITRTPALWASTPSGRTS